jgi:hypothetical protein
MKSHPRAHVSEDLSEDARTSPNAQASGSSALSNDGISSSGLRVTDDPPDELTRIRSLLRPPSIQGVVDWGIPPLSAESCDPAIEASIKSASSNRSF